MPSHLSSIGFPVHTQEEFVAVAQKVAADAQVIPAKAGHYLRWAGAAGEELWLQLDRKGQLIGIVPHFTGQSAVRVGITKRITRPPDTKLDGAFQGWANPPEGVPTDGDYPFVFDSPDAAAYSDFLLPAIVEAQIAAFAHELTFYESEEDFRSAQADQQFKFAEKSFIPIGSFSVHDPQPAVPEAMAWFTGLVLDSTVCQNTVTGYGFLWALVETLGGLFDVVADRELLPQDPRAGGVLSGTFWLSGRILNAPQRKRPWAGRLFGGAS
jgi:hypothetical protein